MKRRGGRHRKKKVAKSNSKSPSLQTDSARQSTNPYLLSRDKLYLTWNRENEDEVKTRLIESEFDNVDLDAACLECFRQGMFRVLKTLIKYRPNIDYVHHLKSEEWKDREYITHLLLTRHPNPKGMSKDPYRLTTDLLVPGTFTARKTVMIAIEKGLCDNYNGIWLAYKHGLLESTKELIRKASVYHIAQGLNQACAEGDMNYLELLLNRDYIGEDFLIDSFGLACFHGHLEAAIMILGRINAPDVAFCRGMRLACEKNRKDIIQFLFETPVNFNYQSAFPYLCIHEDNEMVEVFLKRDISYTIREKGLQTALDMNRLETANMIWKYSLNKNQYSIFSAQRQFKTPWLIFMCRNMIVTNIPKQVVFSTELCLEWLHNGVFPSIIAKNEFTNCVGDVVFSAVAAGFESNYPVVLIKLIIGFL